VVVVVTVTVVVVEPFDGFFVNTEEAELLELELALAEGEPCDDCFVS